MLARFLRWLAGPAPAAPAPTPPKRSTIFSTEDDYAGDLSALRTPEERRALIQARAFPRSAGDSYVFDGLGDGSRLRTLSQVTAGQDATTQGGVPMFKTIQGLSGPLGMPDALAFWYASQTFIGYQMCALIAQNWLVSKACFVPVRDAVRKGFTLAAESGEALDADVLNAINRGNKRYKLIKNLKEFGYFGRVYGIRIAYCKVESSDPEFYVKPFNIDAVTPGSYRGIVQIDPIWTVPELSLSAAGDPTALDFYEPTWWIVNGLRIHKSHFVIMRGPEVPDILKPSYLYGGLSLTQRIYERVYASERTANEAPLLAMSKRMTVFYTDMAQAFANEDLVAQRMEQWAALRDNFGIKMADKEADKIETSDTSLADLDAVIMTQYQLVAAIAEMPATKLLGTTPKGFNATGSYEESSYHESLEQIQTDDLEPLADRHHAVMMRSDIVPQFPGMKAQTINVVWEPLDALTEEEQATVNKTKAETDKVLAEAGALDGHDIRKRLSSDENSGHAGVEILTDGEATPTNE